MNKLKMQSLHAAMLLSLNLQVQHPTSAKVLRWANNIRI